MTPNELKSLVFETVTAPSLAARKVMAFDAPQAALWLGLILMAALHGIYYGILLPGAAKAGLVMPAMANAPLLIAGLLLSIFVVMAYLMAMSGRLLGGVGDFAAMMKVTIWLQAMRLLAQVVISTLSLISPALGWVAMMAVGLWGIFILLTFVATAHEFEVIKAVGVIVMTFFATIIVLSTLMTVFGVATPPTTGGL
ncbi:Yip1 family protein [Pseudooceanicola sp.]|uniref:Yip1 family protein n=1 Tax=Pseudooceanicola sp. TaxID=1914328 RepID=UPI000C0B01C8|nr:hypothetical protein [Pseudooceanicola sp.]